MTQVKIIGGGLAGCEAAWQLAERNIKVDLYEMRPEKRTPAHQTQGTPRSPGPAPACT